MKKHLMVFMFLILSSMALWGVDTVTGVFEKINELSELESGTYYVIYGTSDDGIEGRATTGAMSNIPKSDSQTYALTNNATISTNGLDITNPENSVVWKIGITENGCRLYNEQGEKYVVVNDDSDTGFTLSTSTPSNGYTVTYNESATETPDEKGFDFAWNGATGNNRGFSLSKINNVYVWGSLLKTDDNRSKVDLYKLVPVTAPVISPTAGTYNHPTEVTISCATAGVTIYYTTNNTNPTTSSTQYTAPFTLTESKTVKAIAVRTGLDTSSITTASYTITNIPFTGVFEEVTTGLNGIVSGAHYVFIGFDASNDGYHYAMTCQLSSDPGSLTSTTHNEPSIITDPSTLDVWKISGDQETGYTVYNEEMQRFVEIGAGTDIGFTLKTSSSHTYDVSYTNVVGVDQREFCFAWKGTTGTDRGFSIDKLTVPVKTWKSLEKSDTNRNVLQLFKLQACKTPTFTPVAGTYNGNVDVTINCATTGATIYYTLDGNDPTTSSDVYNAPFTLTENKTVKAIAVKANFENSTIAQADYVITVETPTFSPTAGTYNGSVEVTISSDTENATIHYTLDGTDPTITSAVYNTPFTLTENKTVKAIAVKANLDNSEIAQADYAITFAGTFEKVTNGMAGIEAGAHYIIYGIRGTNTGAMTNVNTSENTRLGNAPVTFTNEKIINPATNIVWELQPNSPDGYKVYSEAANSYAEVIGAGLTMNASSSNGYLVSYNKDTNNDKGFFFDWQGNTGAGKGFSLLTTVWAALSIDHELRSTVELYKLVTVETPVISPVTGTYQHQVHVTIDCATTGSTIYYTTNGNTPTTGSTLYAGRFTLTASATVKAIAVIYSTNSEIAQVDYVVTNPTTGAADLFISEYVSGSDYNQAIEIYNGTGATVTLAENYYIQVARGGEYWDKIYNLDGNMSSGSVLVICNANATTTLYDKTRIHLENNPLTGQYAVGLFYRDNPDPIDVVGIQEGEDVIAWNVAGVEAATQNHTLVRKSSVFEGNTNWAASAGTDEDDSEWIVYPNDTFEYLGWHNFNGVDETLDPAPGTLYISEVSYALAAGNTFMELYNNSDNILSLNKIQLGMLTKTSDTEYSDPEYFLLKNYSVLQDRIMPPHSYLVISSGADRATFQTEFTSFATGSKFIKGTLEMLFGVIAVAGGSQGEYNPGSPRRWQLVLNTAAKDLIIIDDSGDVVGGYEKTSYQRSPGEWETIAFTETENNATPGEPHTDQTLPVTLSSFMAIQTSENFAKITWTTESESSLIGYNVFRNVSNDQDTAVRVNSAIIAAENSSMGSSYSYVDAQVQINTTYHYWLQINEFDGTSSFHGPFRLRINENNNQSVVIPIKTTLVNVYPNPFNPTTSVSFYMERPENIKINIYNIKGQLITNLLNESFARGFHNVLWNGKDTNGRDCASGVYFFRMETPRDVQIVKGILMK
ncbi:MAG: chitobiase/beta-hexosaminidase C-terminal domain-containing protein [Candidatus Cloacimonadales bacterium]